MTSKLAKAFVVTGPTSGIGYRTSLELAKHGTVVLVGRSLTKLAKVQSAIEKAGGSATSVVCDVAEPDSVRQAAAAIAALRLPITALLNNAGLMQMRPSKTALGWDVTFATNYLGPFALTEALKPHLPDGAAVVFIVSAAEDAARKPAVAAGFRGGRYISARASAHGEWQAGGSAKQGYDAYATSKQCLLAACLAFSRETPRLRFRAIEPGVTPTTALGRDTGLAVRFLVAALGPVLVPLLMPFVKILNTPRRAGRMIAAIVSDPSGQSGVYYNERGQPMSGSMQVQDPAFQDRVVAETRAFLSLPASSPSEGGTQAVRPQ